MDPVPEVSLKSERLTLRRVTPDDAELLFELDDDPEVRRWVHAPPPDLERIRRELVPRMLSSTERDARWGFWIAHEGEAFAGWFHLRPSAGLGGREVLELGYRLRQATWGRGLATEGSRALLEWARSVHGVTRVEAMTLVGNRRSQRVLEKLGFRRVEEFLYDPPSHGAPPADPEERRSYRYAWDAPGADGAPGSM